MYQVDSMVHCLLVVNLRPYFLSLSVEFDENMAHLSTVMLLLLLLVTMCLSNNSLSISRLCLYL